MTDLEKVRLIGGYSDASQCPPGEFWHFILAVPITGHVGNIGALHRFFKKEYVDIIRDTNAYQVVKCEGVRKLLAEFPYQHVVALEILEFKEKE